MKSRLVIKEVEEFYKRCPICKYEIVGSTQNQVSFNLGVHKAAKHEVRDDDNNRN